MDTVSLSPDQLDEILMNLHRARAVTKLVFELGERRGGWPDAFSPSELSTVMHIIIDEVEMAQNQLMGRTEEAPSSD